MKENGNWVNRTKEKRADSALQRKINKEKFFKIFDLRNDVDFSGAIFELNKMLNNDYKGYEPSYEIDDVLSLLPISSCDNIVDLGCGKGYALYLLGKYAFGTIKGVEIDDNLVSITINNIRTLYPKTKDSLLNVRILMTGRSTMSLTSFIYLIQLEKKQLLQSQKRYVNVQCAQK